MDVVSIALSQNLGCKKPIKNVQKPTATVVLIFFPLAKYVSTTTPIITAGQGAWTKKFFNPINIASKTLFIASKIKP